MNGSLSASTAEKEKAKVLLKNVLALKVKTDFEDFLACSGEYVVELAGAGAVKETCIPVLKNGKNYVCISIGALADSHSLEQVKAEAELSGSCFCMSLTVQSAAWIFYRL